MSKFDTFQNTQGSIIKRVCGIPKRSHHTQLLRAPDITDVDSILEKSITSLYFRIFKLDNPLRDLCTYDLSVYMSCGHTIPGTITHRILQLGLSPIDCAFNKYRPCHTMCHDGVVNSLRQLIYHENYAKPCMVRWICFISVTDQSLLMFYSIIYHILLHNVLHVIINVFIFI